ncbi:YihY/virulence factor BrkB family protein [Conexibacter woesei]|uniref:YihY/virulence factor BrkB family protein n=1 Tax=Conexibacter woesei TaxID=191495 RepID=UPI0004120CD5|nr:YhjD/YihY/BrkB family envelope integrity protein [Conexibacter woesei]
MSATRKLRAVPRVLLRTGRAFYDDQMTHHAAALTYCALMSLFPALLLAVSILGLVGQYPATYDAILGYLRDVVPPSALVPLDSSLRAALQQKGTAATTLAISVVVTLYGTTGALEAARRALNVVYEADAGRRSPRTCSASSGSDRPSWRSGTSLAGRAPSRSPCSCSPTSTT